MEEDSDTTELWLTWNDHGSVLKRVLTTLRYQELYADVTLVCCEKRYAVHKFVLSTCSAFFENLLQSLPGQHPVIVLTNMSTEDLERLLDFMYLGQTEVNSENLERLLDIAYELRIRGLISSRDDPVIGEQKKQTDENEEIQATEAGTSNYLPEALNTPNSDETNIYSPVQVPDDVKMEVHEEELPEYQEGSHQMIKEEDHKQSREENTVDDIQQNGPEDIKPLIVPKVEEEVVMRQPLLGGLKEFENFIQKYQQSEEVEQSDVRPLDINQERPPVLIKKISKHHDPRCNKGKCQIEKPKSDSKRDKEKAKNGKGKEVRREDKKMRIMMCPGCKKTFMNQSVLEEHMKTHPDLEIVNCSKCSFKALSKLQMKKHLLTHEHELEKKSRPFHCPYCPARQKDRTSFLVHQKTLHPGKKVVNMSPRVVLEEMKLKDYEHHKSNKTQLNL
ncbi:hypothetical protein SK128_021327 [Halocaridina rubra]|uniref:Uncharacterized protein n=1 Tax=Halocaridina rubra TaxID=373956 RepID=A0AAN9A3T1_HALRR